MLSIRNMKALWASPYNKLKKLQGENVSYYVFTDTPSSWFAPYIDELFNCLLKFTDSGNDPARKLLYNDNHLICLVWGLLVNHRCL